MVCGVEVSSDHCESQAIRLTRLAERGKKKRDEEAEAVKLRQVLGETLARRPGAPEFSVARQWRSVRLMHTLTLQSQSLKASLAARSRSCSVDLGGLPSRWSRGANGVRGSGSSSKNDAICEEVNR